MELDTDIQETSGNRSTTSLNSQSFGKKKSTCRHSVSTALWLALWLIFPICAQAAPPDLTQPGVIDALKTDTTNYGTSYGRTYNLGPTGMRGWIYVSRGTYGVPDTYGPDDTMTGESRQILVTVASSPAGDVDLQVDDVILGVGWGANSPTLFTSDARKSFGNAITEAEKSVNGGNLNIRRWRPSDSSTVDVTITLPVMGTYAGTAPYTCPKSTAIRDALRNKLVGQLIANPGMLPTASNGNFFAGSINGLGLLAGVAPGDPNYDLVQTRLQTYARNMANNAPMGSGIWTWAYSLIFLSEYYLSTGDTTVLPGINQYTLKLAQSQTMYGTYGHNPAQMRNDGTGRMSCIGYGPVNAAGVVANLSMVLGKKSLVAASQTYDPQIDAAIQRGADFFAWFVNKGGIPYGEHHPGADNYYSNGKLQSAAVLFSLMDGRSVETEYYSRMSVASYLAREYGHTGQGLNYFWEGMGTQVGGDLATAEYFKNVLWHLDLSRRTDGSFVYDGAEQYGPGKTADGTYLGTSSYNDLNPTASYLLTFSIPLKRLHITGKNANPANTLDSTKVAKAITAGNYNFDRTSRTTTQLLGDLVDYDPITRNLAAVELSTRTLTTTELDTLRSMLGSPDVNARTGACQTLGLLKDATAMPMITQRLDKTVETDPWVRAMAAKALRSYGTTANSQVNAMLTAFAANAIDPDTIIWSDPLQAGNSQLTWSLFSSSPGSNEFNFGATTISAAKNLLYPAVSVALKQPDSASRSSSADFSFLRVLKVDVEALPNDFITLIRKETQCDRMWSNSGRRQGIRVLSKYKFFETMPLGMELLPTHPYWGAAEAADQAIAEIATFGDSARWTLPTLRSYLTQYTPGSSTHTALVNAINSIEAATTSPTISYLKAYAAGQIVTTPANTAKAITLTGSSCREPSVSFTVLTQPSNGTLTGTPPNLTYTPNAGYTGPDHFTFRTADTLTTSEPATVGIVVGTAGTGLKGEYFDNANFSNLVLTRTDAQVNFDWGTGTPNASINADTFSVRWSGQLLVPETCAYTFSALSNDGVRLYINGTCVVDNFVDPNSKWVDTAPIQLTKGQMVEIQMEYYENTGSAAAKLRWTGPSVAGQMGAIIPQVYLFDGTGISNRTPYAHAQTVSTIVNTPKAITLTGSGGTLTYVVLTQPANGTLSGTAPYLTYTPTTNFTGTDSFTFLVNNGTGNSSPATVTITVAAGLPDTFTWAGAVDGNMSLGTNWVSGTAPAAAGLSTYNLNFSPTGTYIVTHDLNNGFQFNQLNFTGNVTLDGTNALSATGNGGIQAQINQNSTNAVTITPPLQLATTTTFGGSYAGKVTLNGLISGGGALIKTNPGTLQINTLSNTYTGGTIINGGTVSVPSGTGAATPFLGTGPITFNPNTTLAVNRTQLSNAITLNGCTITGGNSFSSVLSGQVTLDGITTIDMGSTGGFQISGNVSGTGGLTTIGTTQWTMNGTNTYTGPTTIQAGTIRYQAAASVPPGALVIANTAKANLNYTGNAIIASLTLGGVDMPPGVYGSSASPATFKNDGYFTSTSVGTITILPPTTTSLALTNGSSPANPGTPLTFTATVTGSTPTGSVAFYANSSLLGTSALNGSYQASLTTSTLTSGTYSITAKYLGNAGNASSTSNAVAIVINNSAPPAPTNPAATPGNNQVSLVWTSSLGAAGYYVKRSLTNGGPYTVVGYSTSTGYTDLTASNGATYYYVFSAYNNYGESSDSVQISVSTSASASATSVTSSPVSTSVYDTTVTFTATISVTGAPATGNVTFRSDGNVIGSASVSGGIASMNIRTLGVASHAITATYDGDVNHTGSTSPPFTFVVTPKPVTISGITAANKVYDGTTAATLTGGTITGVISGETVTIIPGNGSFSDPNVGTWQVIASGYALGGTHGGNYTLAAQPTVADASITPRTIQITGTKTYDGTTSAPIGILTISNNVDDANLQLAGTASISSKDAGARSLVSSYSTPVRVQSAKANTGKNTKPSLSVNLATSPINGNTLIAVISTRGTSGASSITGGGDGVTPWTLVSQAVNSSGTITTEIWYRPDVMNATTGITIATANSQRTAAVVMEYSGLLVPASIDLAANSTGSGTTASTGTTATTTQAGELWIGGIGIAHSSPTLGTPANSFTTVDNAVTTATGSGSNNARVYALERVVTSTATASSGGTLSSSANWSGAIATFKATPGLIITGPAAGNYTISGMTGTVTVTAKPLTVSGLTASNKVYDGTTTATVTGSAALSTAEAPGAGSTTDGKPYSGDTVSLSGSVTGGVFATKHVGTNKTISGLTGLSLTGAQSANYTLVPLSTLTASITQKPITVSAVTATKTYDATTSASGTPTISPGLVSGDTTTALSQSFQTAAVGSSNKTLIPAITINDGNSGGNYAVTLTNFTTGTIAPKSLSIGGVTASNKTYDGTTAAALSGTPALLAAQAPGTGTTSDGKPYTGDTLTLGGTPAASFPNKHAGSAKAVTVSGFTLGGAQAGNYNLDQPTGLTANVTQLPLTVTAVTATKTYDATTTATGTPTLGTALAPGDTTTALSQAFETASAGIGNKTLIPSIAINDGNSGANYAVALVNFTTATITPKSLTVSGLTASNKIYDGTTDATLTGTASLLAAEPPGTGTTGDGKPYTGDTISLSGTPTGTFATKHAGTAKAVSISGSSLTGAQAGNYTLNASGLTADISQLAITVTAVDVPKTYDGTTASTGIPTINPSLASGDTTTLSQTFDSPAAGTGNKILTPSITINDGNSGGNYAVTLANFTTGTINQAPLVIAGDPLNVPEGGSATFQAKLSVMPAANITVTVSRGSGDTDVSVQSGSSLTFTTSNWDTYQTVTLAAANDADADSGTATITCHPSDPSFADSNVSANEVEKHTTLTLTNDGNGSTTPSSSSIVEKGVATAISATPNTNYNFLNWTVTNGSATIADANAASTTATISAPATVRANFALMTYTVSYNGNGNTGGSAPNNQTKTHDSPLILATQGSLVKTGYSFAGWNTQADGLGSDYAAGASYTLNAALALHAKWTINPYTITFNSAGGTAVSPITQDYGTSVTAPTAPTRTGYTFAGWSPSVPATMPASDTTCTAQWTANNYTVTFDANGGSAPSSSSKQVTFGATYGTLATTTRNGYVFNGWFTADSGGAQVTAATTVATAAAHTLYAQWTLSATAGLYWSANGTTLGGAGTWDTTNARWGSAAAGPFSAVWNNSSNDIARFYGTAGSVALGTNIGVKGLWFNTTGYTINNGANILSFNAIDNIIVLNGVAAATITGQLGGSGNVAFTAQNPATAGTVTFNGTSTGGWSGSTTINSGITLATTSTSSSINKVLSSTSGITLNGGTIQFNRATNAQLNAISDTAPIGVYGGGTFNATSSDAGGASANENIGAVAVNSGQMNFNWTNGASSGAQMILSGLSRPGNTAALTFSGSLGSTGRWKITGAGTTTAGQIIGPWATTGSANGITAQSDYALYNADFIASAGIPVSTQSAWSTIHDAASNYTMSALATATLSATRNINSLRSTSIPVTVAAGNANITLTSHPLLVGDAVVFSAATMPTGLTAGTVYYVVNAATDTFQVSATPGGTAITPSTAGSTVAVSGTALHTVQLSSGNNLGTYGILNGAASTLNILASGSGALTLPSITSACLFITPGSGNITISAPIIDNGAGALTLVKSGSNQLTLSGSNNYTGGTVLNTGTILYANNNAFGTGTITAAGNSTIGASSTTYTIANNISVASGTTLTINETGASASTTFTGLLSGADPTAILFKNGTSGASGNTSFTNPNNTFTGIVKLGVGKNNGQLNFASLGDSGTIEFVSGNNTIFGLDATAVAPMAFNTRKVQINAGGDARLTNNNATYGLIINTDLVANNTSAQTLNLGGTANSTPINYFNGLISDSPNGGKINLSKNGGNGTGSLWVIANNNNSFTGTVTMNGGDMQITSLADYGMNCSLGKGTAGDAIATAGNGGSVALYYTGGTTISNRKFSIGIGSSANVFSFYNNGSGAITFTSNPYNSNTPTGAGTLKLGGTYAGAVNEISGAIVNNTTASGTSLTKNADSSIWKLSGANSYLGTTTVQGGTLIFANKNALYGNTTASWTTSKISVSSGAILALGVGDAASGYFDSAALNTFLDASHMGGSTTTTGFNSGAILGFDTTNATGGTFTYNSNITNFGTSLTDGFAKVGSGTLILGGANTYTGTTSVTAGKLFINGSLSNTAAALNVASGATLGGTGTIGRNVTIAAGGKLEFNISTDAATHDRLDISTGRDFAFSGASELTITSTSGAVPGTYTLITGGNNISGVAPATLNLPAGWSATVSISGNSLVLNLISTTGDTTPPTLASSAIVDDKSGNPVAINTLVTYTVTFSEDMDASTVTAADFGNVGSSAVTIGTITETSAGVFTVQATPTSAGTLQLKINAGADLKDVAGNSLDTTSAIADNTTLTVRTLFDAWANSTFANGTLGNKNMNFDADNDGLATGVEWVLGGDPTLAGDSASKAPVVDNTSDPNYLIYTYRRTDAANTDNKTSITVEYCGDLGNWIPATPDGTNIIATPTDNFFGSSPGIDKVEVKIKRTLATNGKLFTRLKVVITP